MCSHVVQQSVPAGRKMLSGSRTSSRVICTGSILTELTRSILTGCIQTLQEEHMQLTWACFVTVFGVTLYKCFDSELISFLLRPCTLCTLCVCVCVRRKQTRRRERGVPFYELTPRSNEYKWALICSTLHGWWRAVCDTSRPGSTDTKGANHYPLRAIYHRAGPTNLPVSAHDGCFATSNASALVHADR